MSVITKLNTAKLKREEQVNFNRKILNIVESHRALHESIEKFVREAEHFEVLLKEKAFKPSLDLSELDRATDQAWFGLHYYLRAALMHPSEEVRQASEKIFDVFSKTENPTQSSFKEEYGALELLLRQLDALPGELFEKSGAAPYVWALKQAFDNFTDASDNKIDMLSRQQVGAIKEASLACDKAWAGAVKYLELVSEYQPSREIAEIVAKIDTVCVDFRRRTEIRRRGGDVSVVN